MTPNHKRDRTVHTALDVTSTNGPRINARARAFALSFASFALLFALPAAALPTVFPVQGYLADADGVPLDGEVNAQLTLYTDAVGNDAVYSVATNLDVVDGSFYYYIGSDLEIEAAVIVSNPALFLEITINGETLDPRLEIGAAPYSTLAGRCEVADAILVNDTEITGAGLQRRIAIPCGPNQAIRSVALDGIPVCLDIPAEGGAGDITEVVASIGLNGGGEAGSVSLSVDYAETQRRVSNACPAGQFVVSITEAGTLVCAAEVGAGDIDEVVAGGGLVGGGDSGAVTLSLAAVTCPAGNFQTGFDAAGAPTCELEVGDIAGVTAGEGLLGGGTTGTLSLSVDEDVVQRRIQDCVSGQLITAVNVDGSVTCVDFPAPTLSQFQTKILPASLTADGAVAPLSFSNLVVGRRYRLSGQVAITSTSIAGSDFVEVVATHDGATVAAFRTVVGFGESLALPALATTFVASNTTVDLTVSGLSATVRFVGGNGRAGSFVTIEEVANANTSTGF